MKRAVPTLLIVVLFLIGCNRKSSHPGYSEVASTADTTYFVQQGSITRTDTAVQFQLLREAKDGSYSVQNATTDCNSQFGLEAGSRFQKTGARMDDVAAASVNLISEPKLSSVASQVCRMASNAASFEGEFEVGKAMQVIFGNYDQQKTVSVWKPASSVYVDGHEFEPTKQIKSAPHWLEAAMENGVEKKFLVVASDDDEMYSFGCTTCYLGAFVFAHQDGKWKLQSGAKLIAKAENVDGNIPAALAQGRGVNMSLFNVGPKRQGIKVISSGTPGSVDNTYTQQEMWFVPVGVTVSKALSLESCGGDMCGYRVRYSLLGGTNPEFYDVQVDTNGKKTEYDRNRGYYDVTVNKTETLRLNQNKYVLR